MTMAIRQFDGEYRWLSNFWEAPITGTDGRVWPTAEHAFQAMKTTERDGQEQIRKTPSPELAKRAGRRVAMRADWNDIRVGVMTKIVRRKFEQHADLAAKLLATGGEELEEGNTWGDRFWGTVHGEGQNNLGRILMQVRSELAAKA
jgi:ribA/ribD-fused uncharacterized protein